MNLQHFFFLSNFHVNFESQRYASQLQFKIEILSAFETKKRRNESILIDKAVCKEIQEIKSINIKGNIIDKLIIISTIWSSYIFI